MRIKHILPGFLEKLIWWNYQSGKLCGENMKLKDRLSQLRTESGMKQSEVAKLLNVDTSMISKYERGVNFLRLWNPDEAGGLLWYEYWLSLGKNLHQNKHEKTGRQSSDKGRHNSPWFFVSTGGGRPRAGPCVAQNNFKKSGVCEAQAEIEGKFESPFSYYMVQGFQRELYSCDITFGLFN